jgi:hypothetical protein
MAGQACVWSQKGHLNNIGRHGDLVHTCSRRSIAASIRGYYRGLEPILAEHEFSFRLRAKVKGFLGHRNSLRRLWMALSETDSRLWLSSRSS